MRQSAVEAALSAEAQHAGDAPGRGASLAEPGGAAVRAEGRVRVSPFLEQLDGVRERAGGQRDLVTRVLQQLDERAQDEHVGGVGEVDPDPHRSRIVAAVRGLLSRRRGAQGAVVPGDSGSGIISSDGRAVGSS